MSSIPAVSSWNPSATHDIMIILHISKQKERNMLTKEENYIIKGMAETKDKSIRRTGWQKHCCGKSIPFIFISFIKDKIKILLGWRCQRAKGEGWQELKEHGEVKIPVFPTC
jgi:hypothetical protein